MALDSTGEVNPNLLRGAGILERIIDSEGHGGLGPHLRRIQAVYRLAENTIDEFMESLPPNSLPLNSAYAVVGCNGERYCVVRSELDGTGSIATRLYGPRSL